MSRRLGTARSNQRKTFFSQDFNANPQIVNNRYANNQQSKRALLLSAAN
jgi:hypothetical protein